MDSSTKLSTKRLSANPSRIPSPRAEVGSKPLLRSAEGTDLRAGSKHVFDVHIPYHEIEERQTRWQKALRFEKTDRVPVLTPFHSRYFVSMLGISANKYFWDAETMLYCQVFWKAWVLNNILSDFSDLEARVDQGHYTESWALGCELGFDDHEPWIKSHPVKTEKDLTALEQRDILDNAAIEHEVAMRQQMMELADRYVLRFADGTEVYPAANMRPPRGTVGLFTLATDLRGPDIYLDIKLRPDFAHRLMEIVTGKVIQRWEWLAREFNYPLEGIYICDDSAASLSPQDYRQFVLPYNQRFKERFGGPCTVHCCGRAGHLVPIWADELGVDVLWNFSYETDRRKVAQYMAGKTVLVGNVNWKLICQGTPDEVRADALDVLQTFAAHGGHILSTTNIAPGTDPVNINAMYQAVEAYS